MTKVRRVPGKPTHADKHDIPKDGFDHVRSSDCPCDPVLGLYGKLAHRDLRREVERLERLGTFPTQWLPRR